MADLPPPPELPDVAVVTMVHKVKSKLGYTEINTSLPVSDFDTEKVSEKLGAVIKGLSDKTVAISRVFYAF